MLGCVIRSTLVLAITSFEIIVILSGLWMGGVLSGMDVLIWSLAGMFLHQGAYLAGVVALAMREEQRPEASRSVVDRVDENLIAMQGLAARIATVSPSAASDVEKLSDLIGQMRKSLRDHEAGSTGKRRAAG